MTKRAIRLSSGHPTVTILVPAYNEALTIEKCIKSWLDQSYPSTVLVVNDGSTDNTLEVLRKYRNKIKIVSIKNTGNKSYVQEEGLRRIHTDIFVATDADTLMHKDFVKNVVEAFKDPEVVAFSGALESLKCNWITALREIEYTVSHDLYKTAQSRINYMFVIPGCAGAFRTDIFKTIIGFDHDTLTEDLDFTYKLHEGGYKIFYSKKALVYTQDPSTLRQYIKQMRRWYGGGFQNLLKHLKTIKRPNAAFELSMLYLEGLIFSSFLLVTPIINIRLAILIGMFYIVYNILLGLYSSIRKRRTDLLFYSPLMLILNFVNAYIFLEQFIVEVIFRRRNLNWFHPERRKI